VFHVEPDDLGSGLNYAAWGTMSPAHVSSSLVARPERPGLGVAALAPPAGATRCSGGASNTQHSFVANCPEYETVRGSQAADSIIFESFDALGVWACTRPGLQAPLHSCAESEARLTTLAACSRRSAESGFQAGLRRTAEVHPIDLEAWGSPFVRERLTVHQSGTGVERADPRGFRARGPPAFHVKPEGAQTRVSSSRVVRAAQASEA